MQIYHSPPDRTLSSQLPQRMAFPPIMQRINPGSMNPGQIVPIPRSNLDHRQEPEDTSLNTVYLVQTPEFGARVFIVGTPSAVTFCSRQSLPPSAVPAVFTDSYGHGSSGRHIGANLYGLNSMPMMTPEGSVERDTGKFEHYSCLTAEKVREIIRSRVELFPVKGLKCLGNDMLSALDPEKRQNNSYKNGQKPSYWPDDIHGAEVWEKGVFHAKGDPLKEFVTHLICMPILNPEEAELLLWKGQERVGNRIETCYTEIIDYGTKDRLIFAKDQKGIQENKKPYERFRLVQYRKFLQSIFHISYQIIENWPETCGTDVWIEEAPALDNRRFNEWLRTEYERLADDYQNLSLRRKYYTVDRIGAPPAFKHSPQSRTVEMSDVDNFFGGRDQSYEDEDDDDEEGSSEYGRHLRQHPSPPRRAPPEPPAPTIMDAHTSLMNIPKPPKVETLEEQRRQWQARHSNAAHAQLGMPMMNVSPSSSAMCMPHGSVPQQPRAFISPAATDKTHNPYYHGEYTAAAQYPSPSSRHGSPDVHQRNFGHIDRELFEMVNYAELAGAQ